MLAPSCAVRRDASCAGAEANFSTMKAMQLDLAGDLHVLFRDIVDIRSESLHEEELADAVEAALRQFDHLTVTRVSNSIVAATNLGRDSRVLVAGHLDTVPVSDNLPSHVETRDDGDYLVGRGTCDMKGGVAVALHLAATLASPKRDVTWVFYEAEEIAAEHNGLLSLRSHDPSLLDCDLAILMEPTGAIIEGGCQGTMRFTLTTEGQAAHSARSWAGHNAIHDLLPILHILSDWQDGADHLVEVDGLTYREGLNATMVQGGLAGNVVPPEATVQINYRFAPDKTAQQAEKLMRTMFAEWRMDVLDLSSPARPGLDQPLAQSFARSVGTTPMPKYGWTDVARFFEMGHPALNFGPGDAMYAHKADECCKMSSLDDCARALASWLCEGSRDEGES